MMKFDQWCPVPLRIFRYAWIGLLYPSALHATQWPGWEEYQQGSCLSARPAIKGGAKKGATFYGSQSFMEGRVRPIFDKLYGHSREQVARFSSVDEPAEKSLFPRLFQPEAQRAFSAWRAAMALWFLSRDRSMPESSCGSRVFVERDFFCPLGSRLSPDDWEVVQRFRKENKLSAFLEYHTQLEVHSGSLSVILKRPGIGELLDSVAGEDDSHVSCGLAACLDSLLTPRDPNCEGPLFAKYPYLSIQDVRFSLLLNNSYGNLSGSRYRDCLAKEMKLTTRIKDGKRRLLPGGRIPSDMPVPICVVRCKRCHLEHENPNHLALAAQTHMHSCMKAWRLQASLQDVCDAFEVAVERADVYGMRLLSEVLERDPIWETSSERWARCYQSIFAYAHERGLTRGLFAFPHDSMIRMPAYFWEETAVYLRAEYATQMEKATPIFQRLGADKYLTMLIFVYVYGCPITWLNQAVRQRAARRDCLSQIKRLCPKLTLSPREHSPFAATASLCVGVQGDEDIPAFAATASLRWVDHIDKNHPKGGYDQPWELSDTSPVLAWARHKRAGRWATRPLQISFEEKPVGVFAKGVELKAMLQGQLGELPPQKVCVWLVTKLPSRNGVCPPLEEGHLFSSSWGKPRKSRLQARKCPK